MTETSRAEGATRLERAADIATIVMDDGKANALSENLLEDVRRRFEEARSARATILTGRPGIFSAGFDLGTFQHGVDAAVGMLHAGVQLIRTILEHPNPVITACNGHAYPMGAFLMLAADYRLGSIGEFRIGMNEVAIGLTVPRFALELAGHRLARPAYGLVSTGTMLAPDAAVAAGYLDRVVPPSELADRAREEALLRATVDPTAFQRTRARMHGPLLERLRAVGSPEALRREVGGDDPASC